MPIDAGYIVYDPSSPLIKYYFDKGFSTDNISVTNIENRLELKTFGRFPYIYYAGQTNYAVFELTTIFMPDDKTGLTARQQVDNLKSLVKKRKPLTIENSQEQIFKCDVQITNESVPKLYTKQDFEYIELSIRCTQIDI